MRPFCAGWQGRFLVPPQLDNLRSPKQFCSGLVREPSPTTPTAPVPPDALPKQGGKIFRHGCQTPILHAKPVELRHKRGRHITSFAPASRSAVSSSLKSSVSSSRQEPACSWDRHPGIYSSRKPSAPQTAAANPGTALPFQPCNKGRFHCQSYTCQP